MDVGVAAAVGGGSGRAQPAASSPTAHQTRSRNRNGEDMAG